MVIQKKVIFTLNSTKDLMEQYHHIGKTHHLALMIQLQVKIRLQEQVGIMQTVVFK